MFRTKINGIGRHLPDNIVTNYDLEKIMDTTHDWIVQRTGIEQRHWVKNREGTSDLAVIAAKQAIENSSIEAKDIDMIIFATITPDYFFPGSGCLLQEKLGLDTIPAMDIKQQCTGFVYGMATADQFIRSGMYKNILLIGAEVHSKALDKTTRGRDISVLFGDGAGAMILSATNKDDPTCILSSHLHSEGKFAKELWTEAPGMGMDDEEFMSYDILEQGKHRPYMNGKRVYVHAIKRMCEGIIESLEFNKLKLEDIDLFFFHQANLRINTAVAEKLNIPEEKVFNTIQKYGNTTAATIPIGMHDAIEAGVLKPGMLVATSAFGSGFTWGSSLFRY